MLKRLRAEKGIARATTFVVRSFVYLAYGDVTNQIFVPDAVRVPVVRSAATAEREVRARLLNRLARSTASRMRGRAKDLSRVSPLAAVLFGRAKPSRKNIVRELGGLREELAPLRNRMAAAERKIFYGVGKEPVDAFEEWKSINRELKRRFGNEPRLVTLKQVLSFGDSNARVVDDPLKNGSWRGLLLGVPYAVAERTLLRRKAVELHRLHHEIPAAGKLYESIEGLFGSRIAS